MTADPQEQPPAATGRPCHLLAEGVVIVVSILLAFAVDAAWDSYLERQQFEEDLDQVREQLVVDLSTIREAIEISEIALARLRVFIESSPSELRELSPDSLQLVMSGFRRRGIYDQASRFLEGFVQSGQISRVKDPDVRIRISVWSSLEEELAEDYAAVADLGPPIVEILSEYGVRAALEGAGRRVPGAGSPADAVSRLRADPRAVDLAVIRDQALTSWIRNLTTLRDQLFLPLQDALGNPNSLPSEEGEGQQ